MASIVDNPGCIKAEMFKKGLSNFDGTQVKDTDLPCFFKRKGYYADCLQSCWCYMAKPGGQSSFPCPTYTE